MTEDISFGDWSGFTPETVKTYSETKLLHAMQLNRGGVYDAWAKAELERRRSIELQQLLSSLENATNKVHQEVAILANSSSKLEQLTVTLKNLTWALIFLTVLAAGVPVGIEVWKAYH